MKISPLQAKQIIDFLNETDLKGVEAPIFMDAINNVYAAYQSNNTIDVQKEIMNNIYVFMMRLNIKAPDAKAFVSLQTAIEESLNEIEAPIGTEASVSGEDPVNMEDVIDEVKHVADNPITFNDIKTSE